jgi:hypothetical protein
MSFHSIALLGPLPEVETTAFLPVAFRYSAVSPQPERGDLVKVDVIGDGESLKTYHRQVVSVTELPDERPPCMSVLLAPLDLPLMRQVEVTGRDGSPRVVWLASEAPLVPGDVVHDTSGTEEGDQRVLRAFVSLPILAVPVGAYFSRVRAALSRSSTSE